MTNKAKKQLSDACGWYGMAAILIAFTCVSFQILSPTSPLYVTLSLTGAVGLVIETKSKSAYPAMFLNAIYALVAIAALLRIFI